MCGGLLYVAAEVEEVVEVAGWAKRKVLGATRDDTRVDRLDEDSKLGEAGIEEGLEEEVRWAIILV